MALLVFTVTDVTASQHVKFTGPVNFDRHHSNIETLHQYDSFTLYQVEKSQYQTFNTHTKNQTTLINPKIEFDALSFDPNEDAESIPRQFRINHEDHHGPQLHLVRFVGPIKQEWIDRLKKMGAEPIHYIRNNAYLVWTNDSTREHILAAKNQQNMIDGDSPLHPYLKQGSSITARLQSDQYDPDEMLRVSIQVVDHENADASKRLISSFSNETIAPWHQVLKYHNITVRLAARHLETISKRHDVYSVIEYFDRELNDEIQGQIVAGNFNVGNSGPSGTGYLSWLNSYGFSTNPNDYPIVDIVDDGIGNGSVVNGAGDDTLTSLRDGTTTRLNHVVSCHGGTASGEGTDGHGHININIVGGYDQRAGFPFRDPLGYQRGQGINPYARMAGTRIFAPGFNLGRCGGTDTGLIKEQQDNGTMISSNSWGCASCAGTYDGSSQAFDVGVRDADLSEAGNQQMIMLFAAGNGGSTATTVGSPGNGKNMITVGASENQRPTDEDGNWTDGCAIDPSGANNAMDVIGFSARGPSAGNRTKPEIIAPGTHIQGTASTNGSYNGSGICDQFRPSGQTVFSASSGTSHSTPAAAGIASLYYYWLQNTHGVTSPTPSLMKAYLIAHPTYLTGVDANDDLPSNSQGYGMPNMQLAFDNVPRVIENEVTTFDNSGETWTWNGEVANPAEPVRLVLAYTDAAGATGTSPEVNNLNLSAIIDGNTYLGNNFSGAFSITGGTVDNDNNYEAIFLPAGTSGIIDITVTAANIAGDGIPNSGDATDQDFSIVCYNCSRQPDYRLNLVENSIDVCVNPSPATAPNINIDTTAILGFNTPINLGFNPTLPTGFSASFTTDPVVPGSSSILSLTVDNTANAGRNTITLEGNASNNVKTDSIDVFVSFPVSGRVALSTPTDGSIGISNTTTLNWMSVIGAVDYNIDVATDVNFTSIIDSATVTGTSYTPSVSLSAATTYYWRVRASNSCGDSIYSIAAFETSGSSLATQLSCSSIAQPIAIPDNNPAGLNHTINVSTGGNITDLDVTLQANHTWVGDLITTITHVTSGTSVIVMDRPGSPPGFGCGQDNIDTTIDDEAGTPIEGQCSAPPAIGLGPFSPNNPLTSFDTLNSVGDWRINISDNASGDIGSLVEWCVEIDYNNSSPVNPADYSDLSSSYGVAKHEGSGTFRLGTNWTADNGFNQDSDNSDDDGITASGMWMPGSNTAEMNVNSTGGFIACWFDWNNDGTFTGSEKSIAQTVASGSVNIGVTIPAGSTFGSNGDDFLESRCRLYDTEPLTISATEIVDGAATAGEVEDYRFGANQLTPITLAFTHARMLNQQFQLQWSTTTEAGTIAYNIYGMINDEWFKLNERPIAATGIHSTMPQHYQFQSENQHIQLYRIEELTATGMKNHYGPYGNNVVYGRYPEIDNVHWPSIKTAKDNRLQSRQHALRGQYDFIKVITSETGIQRISYEQLLDLGVDWQGINNNLIALTYDGSAVARYFSEDVFGPGVYIEFVAEVTENLYANDKIYQLSLNPEQVKSVEYLSDNNFNIDENAFYLAKASINQDNDYNFASPASSPWFYQSLLAFNEPLSWEYDLATPHIINNDTFAQFSYHAWGATDWPQQGDHHLQISINQQPVVDIYEDGISTFSGSHSINTSLLQNSNNITVTLPADTGVAYDLIQLDSMTLSYPSTMVVDDGYMAFTPMVQSTDHDLIFNHGFENSESLTEYGFIVDGFSNNDVSVYVKKGEQIALITDINSIASDLGHAIEVPYIPGEYFCADNNGVKIPELQLATENPLSFEGNFDYLMITHPDFITALQPLVQYHQDQGLSIKVINVEHIYAQYSNHSVSAEAIKTYISQAVNLMNVEAVLLVGGDSYDYLNKLNIGSFSHIPTPYFATDETVKYAPVDSLYADVNNDLVPDIAFGRMPVRTIQELESSIDKTINFTNRTYINTAVFATDRDQSFNEFSDQMIQTLPPQWFVEKAYMTELDLDGAQQVIKNTIETGSTLTNFFGHSGPTAWSFERLFDINDVLALQNINQPTVVSQFGCWNTYYVMPQFNTMAHRFMQLQDTGAVAVMGASTLTESFHEKELGIRLIPLLTQNNINLGQAILKAKQNMANDHPEYLDVILGWTLLGDPMITVH